MTHDWPAQHLILDMTFDSGGGAFLCADGALVMDGLAALALLPGLDFLAWMAIPALGVSVTCDTLEHMEAAKDG